MCYQIPAYHGSLFVLLFLTWEEGSFFYNLQIYDFFFIMYHENFKTWRTVLLSRFIKVKLFWGLECCKFSWNDLYCFLSHFVLSLPQGNQHSLIWWPSSYLLLLYYLYLYPHAMYSIVLYLTIVFNRSYTNDF